MSLDIHVLRVRPDHTADIAGIDYSNKSPLLLVDHRTYGSDRQKYAVLKHPGGTCWAGIGLPRSRVSAHFMVFEIQEVTDGVSSRKVEANGDTTYTVRWLLDIPIRGGVK